MVSDGLADSGQILFRKTGAVDAESERLSGGFRREGLEVACVGPDGAVVRGDPDGAGNDGAGLEDLLVLGEGLVPSGELEGAAVILKGHHTEGAAILLGEAFFHGGEESRQSDASLLGHRKGIGHGIVFSGLDAAAVVVQRVAGDVETEEFLLVGELLGTRPSLDG